MRRKDREELAQWRAMAGELLVSGLGVRPMVIHPAWQQDVALVAFSINYLRSRCTMLSEQLKHASQPYPYR